MDLKDWRLNYDKYNLNENSLPNCPIELFQHWFDQAVSDANPEPNAMVLTTSGEDGPSARIVLLKEVENKEFQFYTNYTSQKAEDIAKNSSVFILFFWPNSQRQVRIKGNATKVSREKSVAYFNSRPVMSRVSAIASPQSQKITKIDLEKKQATISTANLLDCPEDWGGYSVSPSEIEFWQGQPNRLHDRIVFKKTEDNQWETYRLAP